MFKIFISLLVSLATISSVFAQKIAEFKVSLPTGTVDGNIPVSVDLDKITFLPESELSLLDVSNGKREAVAFQIENDGKRTMYWIVNTDRGSKRRVFQLVKGSPEKSSSQVN